MGIYACFLALALAVLVPIDKILPQIPNIRPIASGAAFIGISIPLAYYGNYFNAAIAALVGVGNIYIVRRRLLARSATE